MCVCVYRLVELHLTVCVDWHWHSDEGRPMSEPAKRRGAAKKSKRRGGGKKRGGAHSGASLARTNTNVGALAHADDFDLDSNNDRGRNSRLRSAPQVKFAGSDNHGSSGAQSPDAGLAAKQRSPPRTPNTGSTFNGGALSNPLPNSLSSTRDHHYSILKTWAVKTLIAHALSPT